MRKIVVPLVALSIAVAVAPSCKCGPNNPTPVTLRIKNTSRDPVWVDDSDQRMGMVVQRNVSGTWFSFIEAPACGQPACTDACRVQTCDAGMAPVVRRVPPGEQLERTWSGVVQVDGQASCGALLGAVPCLTPENPPVDETFRAQLCYSPSAPGVTAPPDGGEDPVPGALPDKSILCVTREFKPIDGIVELSPERGADCATHSDCKANELCFSGSCTSSCPSNDFPEVGASWQLRVLEPDNSGFFTQTTDSSGHIHYAGSGTVTSASYSNNILTVHLNKAGVGSGAIYLSLPPGYAVPLAGNPTVSVTIIDASTADNPENRALVMRDSTGGLIAAADMAQGGAILGASDTAPFTVSFQSDNPVGCEFNNDCGKRLYFTTTFTGGQTPAALKPGESATGLASSAAFKLLNVTNYGYPSPNPGCLTPLLPYAIYRTQ